MKLSLSWGTSGITRICQGTWRIKLMCGGLFVELSLQVAAWGIATVVFEARSSWSLLLWLPNIPMICSNPNTSCHPNTSWGYVCYDGNHQCLFFRGGLAQNKAQLLALPCTPHTHISFGREMFCGCCSGLSTSIFLSRPLTLDRQTFPAAKHLPTPRGEMVAGALEEPLGTGDNDVMKHPGCISQMKV